MPRVKADNARKRCAHACDNCKRRKEKCDSMQPCSICVKRRVDCHFSDVPASEIRKATTDSRQLRLAPDVDPLSAAHAIDHALNPQQVERTAQRRASTHQDHLPSEAPVPRSARLLHDGRGSFIYFGDSASLSFLQNVRRVTSSILGACPFTTDRLRHSVLEEDPSGPLSGPAYAGADRNSDMLHALPTVAMPDFLTAEALANDYLTIASGRLNLFDTADLMHSLATWTTDPSTHEGIHQSILYLVLAIGSQARPDDDMAEKYFRVGRRQAILLFTEEPSVATVQSHALISAYLLAACRRNAAFMNLGIAIRACHALGLHRADVQTLFTAQQRRARKRAWNTVRILDLYSSASMGRPPATSDFGTDYVYESTIKQQTLTDEEKYTLANQKLCNILEMILWKVYKNRNVSTQVADEISKEYRDWAAKLPPLPLILENEPTDPQSVNAARKLATVHLLGAYHWSIILLTRPFLVFNVSLRRRRSGRSNDQNLAALRASVSSSSVHTLADACIDSAVKTLDIIDDLMEQPRYPKRLPFVLNSTFNSALAIGVAFFGDYDRNFPLREGLEKSLKILKLLAPFDPSAQRYTTIIELLADAVGEFVHKRDRSNMKQHSQRVGDMFGRVETGVDGSPIEHPQQLYQAVPRAAASSSNSSQSHGTPNSSEQYVKAQGPEDVNPYIGLSHGASPGDNPHHTLTTSGLLLSMNGMEAKPHAAETLGMHSMSMRDYPFDPLAAPGMAADDLTMQHQLNLFPASETVGFYEA